MGEKREVSTTAGPVTAKGKEEEGMFKKIVYPTDFSTEAVRALGFVRKLKDAGAKEVVLLHIIDRRGLSDLSRFATKDIADIVDELEVKARKELQKIEKELHDLGFKVTIRIEQGDPFKEILRVEEEEDSSLIVIGARGKADTFPAVLLGSVSYNLVRKATCPVLVVKR